jgi:hypothetical protein
VSSDFPARWVSLSGSMPQFGATTQQYRDGLSKMLSQTESATAQEQEALIALNTLWSAANNPKLLKKYKKTLAKMEPQLTVLRGQIQHNILQQRQAVDVRLDLMKDLQDSLERAANKK